MSNREETPIETNDVDLQPISRITEWQVVPASEAAIVAPRLGAMISVRLEPESASLVRRAARIENVTQSEFVRRTAVQAAEEIVNRQPIRIAVGPGDAPKLYWGDTSESLTTSTTAGGGSATVLKA